MAPSHATPLAGRSHSPLTRNLSRRPVFDQIARLRRLARGGQVHRETLLPARQAARSVVRLVDGAHFLLSGSDMRSRAAISRFATRGTTRRLLERG